MSSEEGRRSPRRAAGWRCIAQAPDKSMTICKVENASAQGFLLDTEVQYPLNTKLMLRIEVRHSGKTWEFLCIVIVRHSVIRKASYMAGTEIEKISEKDEKFLHDYSFNII
ncbi:PilZ domain-containing protein [Allohahella marinimesophila]